MARPATVRPVDPFDLPEWLGASPVTWTAGSTMRGEPRVTGALSAGESTSACDLLAADHAFPVPVLDEEWRRAAHQAWTYEQVLLVDYEQRLTLVAPGTEFTADRVLETLRRLAKAVGAEPAAFLAMLRL